MNYLMSNGRETNYLENILTCIIFTTGTKGISKWISDGLRVKYKNQAIKIQKTSEHSAGLLENKGTH